MPKVPYIEANPSQLVVGAPLALLSAEIPVATDSTIPVLAVTWLRVDRDGNCSGWVKVACGPLVVCGDESPAPLCDESGPVGVKPVGDESVGLLGVELLDVELLELEPFWVASVDPLWDESVEPFCDGSVELPELLCDHAAGAAKSANTIRIGPSCRFIASSSCFCAITCPYGTTRVSWGSSGIFCAMFLPLITCL